MKKPFLTIILLVFISLAMGQNLTKNADSIRFKYTIPELAFAVIKPEGIAVMKVSGYHKIGTTNKKDKANINDEFHLGSNTKAITGFVAAYLVEHDKIKWTTKLFDLFPEWRTASDSAYYHVTLQDLMSHRANIQAFVSGQEFTKLPAYTGTKSEKRMLFAQYLLMQKPVVIPPGKNYSYSNAGYSVAACMIEKVTGKTWEKLVTEILNDKLGLNVHFGWPNLTNADQPWGHWIQNGQIMALPGNTTYDLHLIEPAGDISMTLPNYAKFVQLNLSGLTGTNNLLNAGTYQFLHYGKPDYAIGWANSNMPNGKLSNHSGSAGTFYCFTQIEANAKIAFVIIANIATPDAQKGIFELLKKLKNEYH